MAAVKQTINYIQDIANKNKVFYDYTKALFNDIMTKRAVLLYTNPISL
jgi:hypothetical protein